MITLITGVPGSGKTAWLVNYLLNVKDRPLFVDGIPELKIPHTPCPPVAEWTHHVDDDSSESGKKLSFTFPEYSIIVIDEAQRVYRPRSVGSKVPPEVAAFETHRHLGIDFFLITQHPGLIDSNIRKLIGRHIHFRVTWAGRYKHEWNECADVESKADRQVAATEKYKLPKKAFESYKSAEVHTKHRPKIPFVVWIFAASLLAFAAFGWHVYSRVSGAISGQPQSAHEQKGQGSNTVSGTITPASSVRNSHNDAQTMTTAEYITAYSPRLAGIQHTAPIYDAITKPVDAPVPVGCLISSRTKTCRCLDQQGNNYATTQEFCEQVVKNGIFIPWKQPNNHQNQSLASAPPSINETKTPPPPVIAASPAEFVGSARAGL